MAHHLPADREHELNLFNQMLAGQTDEHILLVQAPGGRGKSTLLREFLRRCVRRQPVAIDLKGRTVGLHEIFYEVCDTLGWSRFDHLAEAVSQLANVTIARNTIIGQATIQVALHADDEGSRSARRAEITRAFFEDLRALKPPPVLIFDTFEAASPDLSEWFSQTFLPHVQRSPGLVVVVGGREVPAETIAWQAHLHHLPPIEDHTHWQNYCEQAGLVLHVEGIRTICVLFRGHPDDIAKALLTVAQQAGRP